MNLKKYQALPPDLQKAVDESMQAACRRQPHASRSRRRRRDFDIMKKAGVQINEVKDIKAFQALMKPVYDSVEGQGGQGVHGPPERGGAAAGRPSSPCWPARAARNVVEGVLLVMMVLLCADVFLGVFSRYVMGRTFTWYDEIARLLFVWIVFLGAAVGVRRGAHFRLHLVVDRFPAAAPARGERLRRARRDGLRLDPHRAGLEAGGARPVPAARR